MMTHMKVAFVMLSAIAFVQARLECVEMGKVCRHQQTSQKVSAMLQIQVSTSRKLHRAHNQVDLTNATNMANLMTVTRDVIVAHKLEARTGGSSSSSLGGAVDSGEGLPPSQEVHSSSSSVALMQVGTKTASDQLLRQLQRAPSQADLNKASNMANLLTVARDVTAAHKLEAGTGRSSSSSLGGAADSSEGLPPSQEGHSSSSSVALMQVGAKTASDQLHRQLQRAPSQVNLTNATNMANLMIVARDVIAAHKLEAGAGGSSSSSLGGAADSGEGLPPSQEGHSSSSSVALLQVGAKTASDQLPRQLQRAPSQVNLTNATNMADLLTVARDVIAAHKLEAGTGGSSSSSLGGAADSGEGLPPSQEGHSSSSSVALMQVGTKTASDQLQIDHLNQITEVKTTDERLPSLKGIPAHGE